eukprot:868599-Amphidinium_carterae.1
MLPIRLMLELADHEHDWKGQHICIAQSLTETISRHQMEPELSTSWTPFVLQAVCLSLSVLSGQERVDGSSYCVDARMRAVANVNLNRPPDQQIPIQPDACYSPSENGTRE